MFVRVFGSTAACAGTHGAVMDAIGPGRARLISVRRGVSLTGVVALVLFTALGTSTASAADGCANAAVRTGTSGPLPDCRAYELVSPDLNHAALNNTPTGLASAAGSELVYQALDAPQNANSSEPLKNLIRAERDPVTGWSGVSMAPPLSTPLTSYTSFWSMGISADLSSTFEFSEQPLSGGAVPNGMNIYIGRPGDHYQLVTTTGTPFNPFSHTYPLGLFLWGNADYTHVIFQPVVPQLGSDPTAGSNTYSWSAQEGLRLVGILPDGTAAPGGATIVSRGLAPASEDGRQVLFKANGGDKLYLRTDDTLTVDVGATQRTIDPDPNPPAAPAAVGVTSDGGTVLFTSQSELTNNANTGRSGGVATDAGRDLYSYSTVTGKLTDLTADTNPADAATGANVQLDANQPFVQATADGKYIYFTAAGDLAPGAAPGHRSLYVWHDGAIAFVANADGFIGTTIFDPIGFTMTPDGQTVAFQSTDNLTGYDNTDPTTTQPHIEVFKATIGTGVQCASCRTDGTRPTADSTLPSGVLGRIRVLSDDGKRLFFHSADSVVPEASSGVRQVFEYADGKAAAISRANGPSASTFLDASTSGEDVFFKTNDELVPNPNAGDDAVYDARVGGGFPIPVTHECSGTDCHAQATPPPALPPAATVNFFRDDNTAPSTVPSGKVTVSRIDVIRGTSGSLKVKVPGRGRLSVSGSGLRTVKSRPSRAQSVTVKLALTAKASSTLKRRRTFKTKVTVAFVNADAHVSKATLSIMFKAATARKGR
jgi:hypothetical protein